MVNLINRGYWTSVFGRKFVFGSPVFPTSVNSCHYCNMHRSLNLALPFSGEVLEPTDDLNSMRQAPTLFTPNDQHTIIVIFTGIQAIRC